MKTKTYSLNGKILTISVPTDDTNPEMVIISKFRKQLGIGSVKNVITPKEFFEDIEFQIDFLKTKQLNNKALLDAFLASCEKHIEIYSRIIDHDLESYLDTILILACAISDAEKMVPINEIQGHELRDNFLACGYKAFQHFIYVHHYNNNLHSFNITPKLVKLTDLL